METFASRAMWKVQVFPLEAGQFTGIDTNIGLEALQPSLRHCAVTSVLLTTSVVLTRLSLLKIV
jgi:hypothetical protein